MAMCSHPHGPCPMPMHAPWLAEGQVLRWAGASALSECSDFSCAVSGVHRGCVVVCSDFSFSIGMESCTILYGN